MGWLAEGYKRTKGVRRVSERFAKVARRTRSIAHGGRGLFPAGRTRTVSLSPAAEQNASLPSRPLRTPALPPPGFPNTHTSATSAAAALGPSQS